MHHWMYGEHHKIRLKYYSHNLKPRNLTKISWNYTDKPAINDFYFLLALRHSFPMFSARQAHSIWLNYRDLSREGIYE
jgi:hypothetical protein